MLIAIVCYLVGSFPTAYIVTKYIKNIDIRDFGSGNPGATNVFRIVGKLPGIITLLIDFLKGFLPTLFVKLQYPKFTLFVAICGVLTIVGHIFSVFLKFRGGKGIATGSGFILATKPEIGALGIIGFLITLFVTKVVSVSSIMSVLLIVVSIWIINKQQTYNLIVTFIGVLIIIRHRKNIIKLIEEKRGKVR